MAGQAREKTGMKILGLGDCCMDYYIQEHTAYPGGNALNVADFAKENGAETAFLGTIGTDISGKHIAETVKAMGIDISHSPIKTGNTVKAAVNIIDGDRVWDPNYFKEKNWVGTAFPPMLSENDMEYVKGFDLVHGSCYSRLEDQFLRIAGLGPLLSFDFADEEEYREDAYLQALCPVLDLGLFSCEHMSDGEIEEFGKKIMGFGCRNTLMTMGKRGQRLFTESGESYTGKAKEIQAIDTMGAGDSFFAAFLTGLLKRGWKKGGRITEEMAVPSLREAAEYSAKNCLVRGSFDNGLKITL